MPKPRSEDDKKHGDKLEPLIERTGRRSSSEKPGATTDPAELQGDDDEDSRNDHAVGRRDVGEPD
jgi:hypothetical protein